MSFAGAHRNKLSSRGTTDATSTSHEGHIEFCRDRAWSLDRSLSDQPFFNIVVGCFHPSPLPAVFISCGEVHSK